MKINNSVCFILFFNLLIFSKLGAQTFENIYDARSESLGRSMSVLGESSTIFGNPATSLSSKKSLATLGAQTRFLLTDIQFLQVGAIFRPQKQSLGFSAQYVGTQDFRKWTINGQYARKLFEKLDAGVRLRGGQLALSGGYGSRFSFDADLGINATFNSKLSFGALLQNLLQFRADEQEQAGTLIRIGAAYAPSKKVKMNAEIQQDFNTGLGFNAGVEYLPNANFSFRLGVRTNPITPSFGIGYVVNNRFMIDSFASYHTLLGVSTGLNLSWFF